MNVTIKRPLLQQEYKLKVTLLLQFLVSHFNDNKSKNLQMRDVRCNNENFKNANIILLGENLREIQNVNNENFKRWLVL